MVSEWTHPICDACWHDMMGLRYPLRLHPPEFEICCWCNQMTRSGIFYRADPKYLGCQGKHEPVITTDELLWC